MKLINIFIVILFTLSTPVMAGELFGDIEKSIGNIANNKALDKAVRDQAKTVRKALKDVSYTIERAALVQKVTENALADRVKILETRIAEQELVIANYASLVRLLKDELEEASGE